jgi:metallo-beta-lactamase class B
MVRNVLAGVLVASCAMGMVQAQEQGAGRGGGRGGGGGGAAAAEFPTAQQFAESKDAQSHVAAAAKIGGSDLAAEAKTFCTATGPQRVNLARQGAGLPPIPTRPVGPIKFFDNLYYIGFNDVGAWAVPTSAGIILFDTLNSTADATDVIEPEMRKAGLDPAQIKIVLLGHGHNDHTGGASYLQSKYGAKVMMAAPDWDMIARITRADRPQAKRDADVTDGQKLTLGDTTVTVVQLPGHTPGTIGMIVPAKYQGGTHNVMIMSGTQMPTSDSLNAFVHVFNGLAKPNHVEAAYGSHPDILMNSLTAMEAIRDKAPTGAHPLLMSDEKFNRYGAIMLECARARLAAQGRLGTQ